MINKYAPEGIGLEIGVGERTISPSTRTILSDGFSEHGEGQSIAQVYFKGDEIPYDNETFSFILSEHVLEHIANPIKSLKVWIDKLKPDGKMIIVLPHKERTNDVYREVTTLNHLISDYENDVPYNDPTHFDDWWNNVVEKGLMPEHYKHIPKDELVNTASIHHHVWTDVQIIELFEYLGLEVIYKNNHLHDRRDSFAIIARKK
jgi:SAM-dependent methyltransferase